MPNLNAQKNMHIINSNAFVQKLFNTEIYCMKHFVHKIFAIYGNDCSTYFKNSEIDKTLTLFLTTITRTINICQTNIKFTHVTMVCFDPQYPVIIN